MKSVSTRSSVYWKGENLHTVREYVRLLCQIWLGEKGISLEKGKNWSTKGGFFFQITFSTFWEVRLSFFFFFNLRLEKSHVNG